MLKAHGYDVFSSDIADRGYGSRIDFMESSDCYDNIKRYVDHITDIRVTVI